MIVWQPSIDLAFFIGPTEYQLSYVPQRRSLTAKPIYDCRQADSCRVTCSQSISIEYAAAGLYEMHFINKRWPLRTQKSLDNHS